MYNTVYKIYMKKKGIKKNKQSFNAAVHNNFYAVVKNFMENVLIYYIALNSNFQKLLLTFK